MRIAETLKPMIELELDAGFQVLVQGPALCHPGLSPQGGQSLHDHTWPLSKRNTGVSIGKPGGPQRTGQTKIQEGGGERQHKYLAALLYRSLGYGGGASVPH